MGERRRYGSGDRAVDAETEAEARALRTIAGLIQGGTALITDREVAIRAGEVLRAAATELYAGRALPLLLSGSASRSTPPWPCLCSSATHPTEAGYATSVVHGAGSEARGGPRYPKRVRASVSLGQVVARVTTLASRRLFAASKASTV